MHSWAIRLDKYSHTQLVGILERRIDHGLIGSRVTDDAVEEIADLGAGNARRAIIDESNTFIYEETNLDGVLDLVSRSKKPWLNRRQMVPGCIR